MAYWMCIGAGAKEGRMTPQVSRLSGWGWGGDI